MKLNWSSVGISKSGLFGSTLRTGSVFGSGGVVGVAGCSVGVFGWVAVSSSVSTVSTLGSSLGASCTAVFSSPSSSVFVYNLINFTIWSVSFAFSLPIPFSLDGSPGTINHAEGTFAYYA